LNAGGSITEDWALERALRVGDKAVGMPVLQELYSKMRDSPHPVNLEQLWQRLGVERRDHTVILRDDAPLAATRKAIMPE
jgi:3-mercaptopyruvate sulfurtransferase SseA